MRQDFIPNFRPGIIATFIRGNAGLDIMINETDRWTNFDFQAGEFFRKEVEEGVGRRLFIRRGLERPILERLL